MDSAPSLPVTGLATSLSLPAGVAVAAAYSPGPSVKVVGPVSPGDPITVAVGLAPRDSSGLAAYLAAEYGDGTPADHRYVADSDLAARYGASSSSLATARAYFASQGLTVTTSPDRLLLFVNGPSSEVARAFGTQFVNYRDASGREFFSHPTPAVLPAEVPWTGAFGLGNVSSVRPAATAGVPLTPMIGPAASCSSPSSALAPCQVWNAYDMAPLLGSGVNGTGFRIGVVDPYSSDEGQPQLTSDLASFSSRFGFSSGTVDFAYPVPSTGNLNASGVNSGWAVEDALDLQWARASSPGSTIEFTFSPDPGIGLYEAIDWLVAHQAVNVISLSWGEPDVGIYNSFDMPCSTGCNASTDGSYAILGPVFQFAAAEGISVFAATGDCGAGDGTGGVSTHYPASDPTVTGVGGTTLNVTSNGTYVDEGGWSGDTNGTLSPGCVNQGGAGGGYAPFPRPWWQTGLPSAPSTRGVPDLSLVAGTAAAIVYHSSLSAVAGTSLATPIWAGITADLDQFGGQPVGFLNPVLYRVLQGPNYSVDFHDIQTGWNGYSAGPGWDPVTGVGTPMVAALAHDLVPRGLAPPYGPATFLSASHPTGATPLAETFTVFASGGSGQYPLEGVYFDDGTAAFASGGTSAHVYAKAGVYAPQSYVVDSSGNLSASPPVLVVAGGGTVLNVSLSASTHTPVLGAAVTLTSSVVGGVGPYRYAYYFGDGTVLNNTTATSTVHSYGAAGGFCASVVVVDGAPAADGGISTRIGIAVAGAAAPNCENASGPLLVSAITSVGARDAPADFPSLFTVSGGVVGGVSTQYTSSDPYVAACECTIFRAPGNYSVQVYANDSAGQHAVNGTNVTVAPPLLASFTASISSGPAPLVVDFAASSIGGYQANASYTTWTFGDGIRGVGSHVTETYSTPGWYVAVASLEDRGRGNASEAFLIDVLAAGPPPPMVVTGNITPAVHLANGARIQFSAHATAPDGLPRATTTFWSLGNGSSAFGSNITASYFGPLPSASANTLTGFLQVFNNTTGANLSVPFSLSPFFALEPGAFLPSADALRVILTTGPDNDTVPLIWYGSANLSGPGTTTVSWTFGDGTSSSAALASHTYASAGNFTATVTAANSFGDRAVLVRGVTVYPLLTISGGTSSVTGSPPLAVTFSGRAAGGAGAPYTYAWTFGDGTGGASATLTHTYSTVGTYLVVLNVSDRAGHHFSALWTITVTTAKSEIPVWLIVLPALGVGVAVALLATVRRRRPPPAVALSP